MLDPSRYSLDATTVGFRKRMKQSVDMESFDRALQSQTDSIKVRRELKETPISEIHVMGGGLFKIANDEKTKTYERQQRQINGYVLRSFKSGGGPIILPPKHGEGLLATPMNMGQRQYGGYNSVVGNYVSSFTEPLQAPLDNNTILMAKAGIAAASESASNPYKALQFYMNMQLTQQQINENQQAFLNERQYNVQKDIGKALREAESQQFSGSNKKALHAQVLASFQPAGAAPAVSAGMPGTPAAVTPAVKRAKKSMTVSSLEGLESEVEGVSPATPEYWIMGTPTESKEEKVSDKPMGIYQSPMDILELRKQREAFAKFSASQGKVIRGDKYAVTQGVDGKGDAQVIDSRAEQAILDLSKAIASEEQQAAKDSVLARTGNNLGVPGIFNAGINNQKSLYALQKAQKGKQKKRAFGSVVETPEEKYIQEFKIQSKQDYITTRFGNVKESATQTPSSERGFFGKMIEKLSPFKVNTENIA